MQSGDTVVSWHLALRERTAWASLAIFFISTVFFAIFIPWRSMADPDAFYHAHISRLIWEQGPIREFTWLDLTTLGSHFADHHFLFHLIEAPFVIGLGEMAGARIVAILLASLCIVSAFLCLRWMKIRNAAIWTLLLLTTSPLVFRLLLMKATPLALMAFLIGLTATWKHRPVIVAATACFFALSHGGWIFLLGSIVLMSLGDMAFRSVVEEESASRLLKKTYWLEFMAASLGIVCGIFLHPNSKEMLSFLWIQVVKIGLGTPFAHVVLGGEWLPLSVIGLISRFALWWILGLVAIYGLLAARRVTFDREAGRAVIVFAVPFAACLALVLKSQRNVEYLAPVFCLWIAWLWMLIDAKQLSALLIPSAPRSRWIVFAGLTLFCAIMLRGLDGAWESLHRPWFLNTAYQEAFAAVRERAAPGDRVFHSDWDEFPVLFRLDDRLRYVAGLDPTFLYEASSTLSDAYRDLTWGQTSSTSAQAWEVIHDRLDARFVFISKKATHRELLDIIRSDQRYAELKDTSDAATFEVLAEEKK